MGFFSFCHHIKTGSESHSASYPMSTRGSFPRAKAAGGEDDHSPFTAEVNNV